LGSRNPLFIRWGDVSIKASKRLEAEPFSLAGRGRSPAAGVPCAPPTLAAATTLGMNSTCGYCCTACTVAPSPSSPQISPQSSQFLPCISFHNTMCVYVYLSYLFIRRTSICVNLPTNPDSVPRVAPEGDSGGRLHRRLLCRRLLLLPSAPVSSRLPSS
jgi:hypothetical protein